MPVPVVAAPPTALVRRARRMNRELGRLYPDARIELNFTSPLELLVATILSARTTDHQVNEVTRVLFARYRTAADYAAADLAELEQMIEPTGFFRTKAKNLIALGQALCDGFGGEVPDTLEELVTLPGVGRKTANVVLGDAFGKPGITVDTHVARLARRFGWTAQTDPDKIEQDIAALLPRREWTAASHRLIWHGRRVCHARQPACGACGVARWCPSFGLGPTDEATARKLVKTGPFSLSSGGRRPAHPRTAGRRWLPWRPDRRETRYMGRHPGSVRHPVPGPAAAQDPGGLPAWVEPQLATLTKDRFSDPAWIFERKLDGERCLAFRGRSQGARLLTRNQHDVTGTFPEIASALDAQRMDGFIVDGEIVAFTDGQTKFEQLQQRLGVAHPEAKLIDEFPVFYYIFDVMYADGRDTRPLPELDRKRLLADALSFGGPLRYTEHRVGGGEAFYRSACQQGWEGLIAKRADAPYQAGRTRNWLKFKCLAGQEFVIGGYTDPRGSRQGLGALLLGYYDAAGRLTYAGKVGTGFNNQMLRRLQALLEPVERDTSPFERGSPPRAGVHWVQPRLVGEIAFAEWTDDGLLRQPRFQGLRDDKDASEVVRETPQ